MEVLMVIVGVGGIDGFVGKFVWNVLWFWNLFGDDLSIGYQMLLCILLKMFYVGLFMNMQDGIAVLIGAET